MKTGSHPKIWSTQTFNRLARYYDSFMRIFFPVGEKGRERIVEELDAGCVLDVACGTGTLLAMARNKGLQCFGLDLSPGMLRQATMKVPYAHFVQASYYALPYPDSCFEYVVATNALSGVFVDAKRALAEMFRVCKHGGHLYLAEWLKASNETWQERLVIWLASINEDAPKDYPQIFKDLGVEPLVESLGKRYHILGVKKR